MSSPGIPPLSPGYLFPNGYASPNNGLKNSRLAVSLWRPLALARGDLPLALNLPSLLSLVTGKASVAAKLRHRVRTRYYSAFDDDEW